MTFKRFTKDPDAILDYEWDWSQWLAAVTDTIATVTFIVDTGLTVVSSSHTTTSAIAWISGGATGSSYNATCRITTTDGRTDDRTITLRITDL